MNFRAFITATEDFGNSEKRHRGLSFIIILNMRDIVLIGTSGSGCNAAGFLHVKLQTSNISETIGRRAPKIFPVDFCETEVPRGLLFHRSPSEIVFRGLKREKSKNVDISLR